MTVLAVLGMVAAAQAQGRGGGRHRKQQDPPPQSQQDNPPPQPPSAKSEGPQLRNGSVVCTSRAELVKLQIAEADGTPVGSAPANCRTIMKPTGIQIISRDGPSRTEITTTDDPVETGWTNTYFPPDR